MPFSRFANSMAKRSRFVVIQVPRVIHGPEHRPVAKNGAGSPVDCGSGEVFLKMRDADEKTAYRYRQVIDWRRVIQILDHPGGGEGFPAVARVSLFLQKNMGGGGSGTLDYL